MENLVTETGFTVTSICLCSRCSSTGTLPCGYIPNPSQMGKICVAPSHIPLLSRITISGEGVGAFVVENMEHSLSENNKKIFVFMSYISYYPDSYDDCHGGGFEHKNCTIQYKKLN